MLTGQALRDWLAWVIHNRKPERRASTPARKKRPRDEHYKAWIRTLPCVACGVEGRSEAAHTGTDGGMSMKASDYSCVPCAPTAIRKRRGRTTAWASGRLSISTGFRLCASWRGSTASGWRGAREPRTFAKAEVPLRRVYWGQL